MFSIPGTPSGEDVVLTQFLRLPYLRLWDAEDNQGVEEAQALVEKSEEGGSKGGAGSRVKGAGARGTKAAAAKAAAAAKSDVVSRAGRESEEGLPS
eukprot:460331-Prorocentrum_minimum.AAC.1